MSGAARLGAVALVLAAGIGLGHVTAAEPAEPRTARAAPVVAATAVCPDAGRPGTTVAAAPAATSGPLGAPPSTTVAAAGPGLTSGPLGAPPQPLAAPVLRDLADGAHVVTARGDGAGALSVVQRTRTASGAGRGAAALVCPAPAVETWFVGGATVVGATSELVLVNVEDTPAVVDVRVWTAGGPADRRPGRGTAVPARTRVVVPLDRLAPDRDLLAVHVDAVRGRVASALRVTRADGRTPLGTDWVPQAQPPAGEQVVAGLAAGPGSRTALVTNPGEDDAVVRLELATGDGTYVPEGAGAVLVPAGTSVAVDLSAQLSATPAALRVVSDGPPVLAGAVLVDGAGTARDAAWAAAVPVLDAAAVLADVDPDRDVLLLSALDGDATVALGGGRLDVPSGTTVAVPLTAGGTLRPLTGRVHAAHWSLERGSRGPLTALLPVLAGRLVVSPPVVVPAG